MKLCPSERHVTLLYAQESYRNNSTKDKHSDKFSKQ